MISFAWSMVPAIGIDVAAPQACAGGGPDIENWMSLEAMIDVSDPADLHPTNNKDGVKSVVEDPDGALKRFAIAGSDKKCLCADAHAAQIEQW